MASDRMHADLEAAAEPRSTASSILDGDVALDAARAHPEVIDPRRMVIVPRRPGILREAEARRQRPRDELDDLIYDLFGETTDEKPGRFDAGLVIAGLLLSGWAFLLGGPAPALWFGIAAIVLGLALPVRGALRAFDWSRAGGLRRRIIDRGLLLDASHPATVALIDTYAHLIQMSCLQGTGDPKRAVTAGHMAIVESARHLEGEPPGTPARVRFVSMRTDAIEALSRQMLRSHDRWAAKAAVRPPAVGAPDPARAPAGSEWESLNALARTGTLEELQKLNDQLGRETTDGDG